MAGNFSIAYTFKAIDNFTRVVRRINKIVDQNNAKLLRAAKAMQKYGKQMRDVGRQMTMRVTVPIIAMGTGFVMAAAQMEKGLTNVYTLLSKDEFIMFEKRLDKASVGAVKLGFGIQDANKGLFDTVSALGATEQAFRTYEIGQKLAIGGVTTLTISLDGLTSIINAYGREVTTASDVSNAFFTAQKFGKTTVEELALNVGKVAPIAKQAGIGFKELLAVTAQLTLGGLDTQIATTALRQTIAALIKPSNDAAKVLKKFGVPMGATELRAKGLGFALMKLNQAAEVNADVLALAIPNIRAFTGAAAIGFDEIKNIDKIIKTINDDIANGTGLNEAYAKQLKTFTQKWKELIGQIKMTSRTFGVILMPILIRVFAKIEKGLEWVERLSTRKKKLILIVMGLVAVIGPLLIVLGSMLSLIGLSIKGFIALKGVVLALNITLPMLAMSFRALWIAITGPIGLIIGGIIILGLLAKGLYHRWKPFKDSIDSTYNKIKMIASMFWKIQKFMFGVATTAVKTVALPYTLPGKLLKQWAFPNSFKMGGAVDINVNAPKGTGVKTTSEGPVKLNTGLNMAGAT